MAEFVQISPGNYDINLFDIDPMSVSERKFTDQKTGKDNIYYTGVLLYDGKVPTFIVEGDSYGISKGDDKDKAAAKGAVGAAPPAVAGMVQLPSAAPNQKEGGEGASRDKWQVSIKLSEKAHPKEWTDAERAMITFIDDDLRNILAYVLAKRVDILGTIKSNVIVDAQQDFSQENQPGRFPNEAAMLARFTEIVRSKVKSKVSHKVYRKKKTQKPGETVNFMDAASQYDETKHPTLYAGIKSFVSKKTNVEEFSTKYYQWVKGAPEEDWPKLTHHEAVAKGWYRMEVGVRFDNVYFGSSIAPQLKVEECVLKTPIENKSGLAGRMIRAGADVKRDQRLISRTVIQPAGATPSQPIPQTNGFSQPSNATPGQFVPPTATTTMQFQPAPSIVGNQDFNAQARAVSNDQGNATAVFDTSVLNGIGLGVPTVTSNYGNQ